MLKLFLHIARNTERKLERQHDDIRHQAEQLRESASVHLDFLNDTMIELQGRMHRTKAVQEGVSKLLDT